MFHLRFGLSDHLKTLRDFVFGSRRRVKKVRIFRAWFSHQLTVRSSSKPTLPSCALSSPTAQFLGISAVTVPIFVLFLRPVGLLSTMNLNRGNTPASLFSLRVLPAHASKFSLVTVNKPVQGRVATFCVNLYSSVSPIKELVSLMALLPSFLLRCWLLSLQLLQMKAPFHSSALQDQILSLSYLLSPHKSSLLPATPKTVRAAEGHVPTAGVLLHLILPHSLRCPADAYQVAMHYPSPSPTRWSWSCLRPL